MINFQDCKLENSDPLPFQNLLDLVGLPAHKILHPKGGIEGPRESQSKTADGIGTVLIDFLRKPSSLAFYESPYEYFFLSFYLDLDNRKCGLFRTESSSQTSNTMKKLASKGISFLEFSVALQRLFSSASFADENTNSIDDYINESADLQDRISLPVIAFGLPDGVRNAMLLSPEYQLWDTEIGEVCGNKQFCEGALPSA